MIYKEHKEAGEIKKEIGLLVPRKKSEQAKSELEMNKLANEIYNRLVVLGEKTETGETRLRVSFKLSHELGLQKNTKPEIYIPEIAGNFRRAINSLGI